MKYLKGWRGEGNVLWEIFLHQAVAGVEGDAGLEVGGGILERCREGALTMHSGTMESSIMPY